METICLQMVEPNHHAGIVSPVEKRSNFRISFGNNMSHVMRKPTFCICENKDADQRLCFRYIDSTIPLLS